MTKPVLRCDIVLGGSTTQFLDYNSRNLEKDAFIESIKKAIRYKAKTKPAIQAKRSACLMGICLTTFKDNEYMLTCLCTAINQLGVE